MLLFRSVLLILAVVVAVQGQLALPEPIKQPITLRMVQQSRSINVGVASKHMPNTDSIVAVWIEEGADNSGIVQGAIFNIIGEVKTTFEVDAAAVSYFVPPIIVPRANGSFSVIYTAVTIGSIYKLRNFNASGSATTDPIPIPEGGQCLSANAALDERSGDIFLVCAFQTVINQSPIYSLTIHRINATGYTDSTYYSTDYPATNPTIAISGDRLAVSTALIQLDPIVAKLQIFTAPLNDFGNVQTFFPYDGVQASTVSQSLIADPFNDNAFIVFSSTGLNINGSVTPYLTGIRFTADDHSIASTQFGFTDFAVTSSVTVNQQGAGVMMLTSSTVRNYVLFPIQIKNDSVFDIGLDQFNLLHAISVNETKFNAYSDLRTATTTWSTGSAAVWSEFSLTSGSFSIVAKIFGAYCGDNVAEGNEECDGGASCNTDCTCPNGLVSDKNNGCAVPPPSAIVPNSSPSTGSPSSTGPISVGPVNNAPNTATSDAADTLTAVTVTAALIMAVASLFEIMSVYSTTL